MDNGSKRLLVQPTNADLDYLFKRHKFASTGTASWSGWSEVFHAIFYAKTEFSAPLV